MVVVTVQVLPYVSFFSFKNVLLDLCSKIVRVNQLVVASREFRRGAITAYDFLVPFFIIFTLNVGLLLVFTLVDPLMWQRVSKSDGSSSYGTCWHNLNTIQVSLLILLTVVNLFALILVNIQAYKSTRMRISDEFSGGRYMGFAVASMLQVFMIGLPVMFLVASDPKAFFFVQSSLVFAIAMPLQIFVFVPKILHTRKYNDETTWEMLLASTREGSRVMRTSWDSNQIRRESGASSFSQVSTGANIKLPLPEGDVLVDDNVETGTKVAHVNSDEKDFEVAPTSG